jgi:hypothetical protein
VAVSNIQRIWTSNLVSASFDLKKYCAGVEAGEGRLFEFLQKNDAQVSGGCKQARKDVGTKERGIVYGAFMEPKRVPLMEFGSARDSKGEPGFRGGKI